jgi:hypothetical protein
VHRDRRTWPRRPVHLLVARKQRERKRKDKIQFPFEAMLWRTELPSTRLAHIIHSDSVSLTKL